MTINDLKPIGTEISEIYIHKNDNLCGLKELIIWRVKNHVMVKDAPWLPSHPAEEVEMIRIKNQEWPTGVTINDGVLVWVYPNGDKFPMNY